jgi:hypothetical protein
MDRTLDWAIKRRLFESRLDGIDPSRPRDGSAELRRLWAELCEIDIRFGQLGADGLFQVLERRGLLDHHVPRVRRIARAAKRPPAGGRAHLRGRWIRRLAPDGGQADWMTIVDRRGERWLDLRDPFGREEKWVGWGDLGRRGEMLARLGMLDMIRAEVAERARAASPEADR